MLLCSSEEQRAHAWSNRPQAWPGQPRPVGGPHNNDDVPDGCAEAARRQALLERDVVLNVSVPPPHPPLRTAQGKARKEGRGGQSTQPSPDVWVAVIIGFSVI